MNPKRTNNLHHLGQDQAVFIEFVEREVLLEFP
jgi:hypothetical protein